MVIVASCDQISLLLSSSNVPLNEEQVQDDAVIMQLNLSQKIGLADQRRCMIPLITQQIPLETPVFY